MARKRITYTAEFKLQAVQMIVDQHLSVAEVARRLGVNLNMLHLWKKAFLEQVPDAFAGQGRSTPAEDELRRLRAEVARLRAERYLKKPPSNLQSRRVNFRFSRPAHRSLARHLDVRGIGSLGQ